jgi:hypothetical protein
MTWLHRCQIGYRVRFNDASKFEWDCFRDFNDFYFEEDVK